MHLIQEFEKAFKRTIALSLVFIYATSGYSQSVHNSLLKGDRQYDRNNFKAAEKQYRIAADLEYSSPKSLYNLGNSLYQQGKWEDAAERFELAAKYSTDKIDQANALYNLGNAFLKQQKFKEAVAAYENSLHLRPGDAFSKTNLQMAKKKLQEEQQKQQQSQDKPRDKKQDQNQSQSPQNQQDKQAQQPPEKPKQPQSGQPQQPDPQQEQPEPGKMKKEEAKRMLETAVGPEDQRNARKYRSAQPQNKPKGAKKDW